MKAMKCHPTSLASFQINLVLVLQYLKAAYQLHLDLWFKMFHLKCSLELTLTLCFRINSHEYLKNDNLNCWLIHIYVYLDVFSMILNLFPLYILHTLRLVLQHSLLNLIICYIYIIAYRNIPKLWIFTHKEVVRYLAVLLRSAAVTVCFM